MSKTQNAEAAAAPAKQELQVHPDHAGEGKLKFLGGSLSDDFNDALLHQAVNSAWFGHNDEAGKLKLMQAAVGALQGIAPADEIEGMLAAQMIATHNAAMECYRRAMLANQPMEGRDHNLTQANKLSRSYATLVQALDKHRGKGNQTVRVENVHVHEGGQAIVGNVSHGGKPGSQNRPDLRLIEEKQGEPLVADMLVNRGELVRK